MTDDSPRRPLHDTVERRREVSHSDEYRGQGIDPRRVTSNPNAPITRGELEAFETRVMSEVNRVLDGYSGGLEGRVRDAVRFQVESAIAPFKAGLGKLEQIALDAAEIRRSAEEAAKYRTERETREKVEKENAEKRAAEDREAKAKADREKVQAEISLIGAQTSNIPVESGLKYRQLKSNFVTGVVVAFLALLGAMIKSRL